MPDANEKKTTCKNIPLSERSTAMQRKKNMRLFATFSMPGRRPYFDGLDPDCLATAAIFAALSDMIASYGEEPVADMCARLPERIRMGEFTVSKTKQ